MVIDVYRLERKITDMALSKKACTFDEWEALIELQCPLPPRAYKYTDEKDDTEKSVHTTARLYHGKFWIRHPETGVIYEAITKPKDIKKHQTRLDQMRAVDEYLNHFKLTSSVEIYKRFKKAVVSVFFYFVFVGTVCWCLGLIFITFICVIAIVL